MQFLDTPTALIQIVNQVFDMEKKLEIMTNSTSLLRNIRRVKASLEEMNLHFHNPIGEKWDETRTDCEATISGTSIKKLRITEVIKPIITKKEGDFYQIIQKGVVVVEGR
jgi:hypothetical protein